MSIYNRTSGLDLSNWQGDDFPFNYLLEADQIEFAFAKCTEGTFYKDPTYREHMTRMTNTGVIPGAYHYAHPSQSSPLDEFNFFKSYYGESAYSLIALDLEEDINLPNLVTWVAEFMDLIERHYNVMPILYTSRSFLNRLIGTGIQKYPVWLADPDATTFPYVDGWPVFFWQHAWKGSLAGHSPLDLDVFDGTAEDLHNLMGLSKAHFKPF